MNALYQWAIRHQVPAAALRELRMLMGHALELTSVEAQDASEAWAQSKVRLAAADAGWRLYRNNVGALKDSRGVPVRYGLANDSAALNKVLKSADLIGWRPVTIEQHHVGGVIAQFVSREVKEPGWHFTGTEREQAQQRWLELVIRDGGDAKFTTGEL